MEKIPPISGANLTLEGLNNAKLSVNVSLRVNQRLESQNSNESIIFTFSPLSPERPSSAIELIPFHHFLESISQGEVSRFEELLPQYEAAPEVTRQRIYLETMEELFSNTSKIMVDNQNGGGSMMYLPLDKIMDRQNTNSNMSLPTNTTQNALDGLRNAATPDANGNSRPTSNIRGTNSRTGR